MIWDLKSKAILWLVALQIFSVIAGVKIVGNYRESLTVAKVQITTLHDSLQLTEKQLTAERESTRQQTALEQAERAKLNDDEKEIKTALSAHDCAAVALPDGVIKRLQQ